VNDIDFFDRLRSKFGINLTEQQKKAVTNLEGPVLVLAVPGSGKTTTLLSRTAYLISHGIKPENILTVTFSKMSTKDMLERFNRIFGGVIGYDVKFSTIHSLAYSIVRGYNYKNNIKSIIIESDEDKNWKPPTTKSKLLRQINREINNTIMTEEQFEDLSSKISFVKNMMLEESEFDEYNWSIENFKKIYDKYESIKRENSYIDYDDMLSKCLYILEKDRGILGKYQSTYTYIQVDEAQDTSKVQHKIIKLLGSNNDNVFYVADDDQSIYGFRGAYPEFLLNVRDIYKNVKIFYMEENFRSTPNIVSVCNQLIKENETRFDKNIFTNKASGQPIQILKVKNKEEQLWDIIEKLKKRDE